MIIQGMTLISGLTYLSSHPDKGVSTVFDMSLCVHLPFLILSTLILFATAQGYVSPVWVCMCFASDCWQLRRSQCTKCDCLSHIIVPHLLDVPPSLILPSSLRSTPLDLVPFHSVTLLNISVLHVQTTFFSTNLYLLPLLCLALLLFSVGFRNLNHHTTTQRWIAQRMAGLLYLEQLIYPCFTIHYSMWSLLSGTPSYSLQGITTYLSVAHSKKIRKLRNQNKKHHRRRIL